VLRRAPEQTHEGPSSRVMSTARQKFECAGGNITTCGLVLISLDLPRTVSRKSVPGCGILVFVASHAGIHPGYPAELDLCRWGRRHRTVAITHMLSQTTRMIVRTKLIRQERNTSDQQTLIQVGIVPNASVASDVASLPLVKRLNLNCGRLS
jgi:hypothetical protein